jgi:hypothetical protein
MNAASNLASRKLVAGILAILAIALNARMGLGLTDAEVTSIRDIALAVIGSQAGVDLAGKAVPVVASWLSGRSGAPVKDGTP